MKPLLPALTLLGALCIASCATSSHHAPLATAPRVELKRYAGRWHEIARLPNSFQRDDSAATAEYTPMPDGSIRVVNTEYRPGGKTKQAVGKATPVPNSGNGRLRVEFSGLAGVFAPNPEEGNYWIIKLSPDYSTAMVGTPDRKYLWLLSRNPRLPKAVRDEYVQAANRMGYPTEKLIDDPVRR